MKISTLKKLGIKGFFLFEYWNLLIKGSLSSNDKLIKEFNKMINNCHIDPEITLKGLYDHSGIEFTITTCCITSSNYVK